MEKIKRGLWLYYGVQTAIFVFVLGAYLGVVAWLDKKWGLDFGYWGDKLIGFLFAAFAIFFIFPRTEKAAEHLAKAACRVAKLPTDGRDALWSSRWLVKSESSTIPLPEPPPLYCPKPLALDEKATLWGFRIVGALSAACVIWSLFDRDWEGFLWSSVCALLFLGGAVLLRSHIYALQVDEKGLLYGAPGDIVSWDAVECGWISSYRGFDGQGKDEWLCLQNAHGGKIFAAPIHLFPPQVRADLFAWIQARTGLREPEADA